MTAWTVGSLVASVGLVVVAASGRRRLPPQLAARFLLASLVVVLAATVPVLVLVALTYLAHVPVVGVGAAWCAQAMGVHGSVPVWVGLPAIVLVAAGAVRCARVVRQHRTLRLDRGGPVHVAHSDRPFAVTLPGRGGRIVISTAMVELLDDDERRIVIAHEEAHARFRHDRYLLVAAVSEALLPPSTVVTRRLHVAIERWADEAAAAVCGDRDRVARTVGKVALSAVPRTVAAFGGTGVTVRVASLLEPPVERAARRQVVALWLGLTASILIGLHQLHELERLVAALCPH